MVEPETAQHLGARALGELEIGGVVDDAGGVGVLVVDPDADAVDARLDAPDRSSAPVVVASRVIVEQADLRLRIARRREAEVLPGEPGQQAAARRALQQPLLQEIGLDHLFQGVALLGQRRGERLDADQAAAVALGDA